MNILGIDPGFASGGAARLVNGKFELIESLPSTHLTEIDDRVDSAVAWFCSHVMHSSLVCVENQHGAAYGQHSRTNSGASVAWVREVVGGIRRACYEQQIPVRLIEPQEWRTRLGLPRTAKKKQAWLSVCGWHPELSGIRTNEHSRDAAVIAHVGGIAANLWLMTWRERHGRNAA